MTYHSQILRKIFENHLRNNIIIAVPQNFTLFPHSDNFCYHFLIHFLIELKFCEVSQNYFTNRCWKFQLFNKKVLFLKKCDLSCSLWILRPKEFLQMMFAVPIFSEGFGLMEKNKINLSELGVWICPNSICHYDFWMMSCKICLSFVGPMNICRKERDSLCWPPFRFFPLVAKSFLLPLWLGGLSLK